MVSFENPASHSDIFEHGRQSLSGGVVAGGALNAIRSALPQLWPLLLAMAALGAASAHLLQTCKPLTLDPGRLTAAAMAYELAIEAAQALLSAVAIRILLGRRGRAWDFDRGLLIYIGLIVASGMAYKAVELLFPHKAPLHGVAPDWAGLGAAIGVMIALWRGFARLILWPIGALVGEPVTPARSYFVMQGAVWPFISGLLLLTVPIALLGTLIKLALDHRAPALGLVLAAPVWGSLSLVSDAAAAEIYRRLIGAPVGETVSA